MTTTKRQVTRDYAISQLTKAGCRLDHNKHTGYVRSVRPSSRKPLGIRLLGYVDMLGAELLPAKEGR